MIKIIRATELRMFAHCSRYYFDTKEMIAKGKKTGNKFTDVGKQIHALLETAITHDITDKESLFRLLNLIKNTTVEERVNTVAYLDLIREKILDRSRPLWLERTVKYEYNNDLLLTGTMDCVLEKSEGKYLLLDHKTNRKESSVEYWRNNMQSMVYAFLLQQLTGATEIEVVFGFPFLNLLYQFTYDKDDLRAIAFYIRYQLEKYDAYSQMNLKEMTPNEECKWCPSRTICPVYRVVTNSPILDLQNILKSPKDKLRDLEIRKDLIENEIQLLLEKGDEE